MIQSLHHVQITATRETEAATIHFYKNILGLREIPKPENLKKNGGAWFEIGIHQLHIGIENIKLEDNSESKRHPCLIVADLEKVAASLRQQGVKIIEDHQPIKGWKRFYLRDPAGNRLEIAEMQYD